MPYKKTIVLLIIGLFAMAMCLSAEAYQSHRPDPGSTKAWGEGDYQTRGEIENQWAYERRVIELENERENDQWYERLERNAQDEADRLGYEKTW